LKSHLLHCLCNLRALQSFTPMAGDTEKL
jgi:hypothetical protein